MHVVVPCYGCISLPTLQALGQERAHHRTNMPTYRPDLLKFRVSRITVRMDQPHDYGDALAELWARGEGFINLEHDVAPWPGALTQMWDCSEPWCAMPLMVHKCINETNLGCMKFSAAFIAEYKDLWSSYPRNAIFDWRSLDAWLYGRVQPRRHHRHGPPALHGNYAHIPTVTPEEWTHAQAHSRLAGHAV